MPIWSSSRTWKAPYPNLHTFLVAATQTVERVPPLQYPPIFPAILLAQIGTKHRHSALMNETEGNCQAAVRLLNGSCVTEALHWLEIHRVRRNDTQTVSATFIRLVLLIPYVSSARLTSLVLRLERSFHPQLNNTRQYDIHPGLLYLIQHVAGRYFTKLNPSPRFQYSDHFRYHDLIPFLFRIIVEGIALHNIIEWIIREW